jgi:ferredoxin-NADP reductase
MTLLYGSRNKENILFFDELEALEKKCDKIKVVHVFSDEKEVIAVEGAGVSAKVAVSASTENFGEIIILKNKEF